MLHVFSFCYTEKSGETAILSPCENDVFHVDLGWILCYCVDAHTNTRYI